EEVLDVRAFGCQVERHGGEDAVDALASSFGHFVVGAVDEIEVIARAALHRVVAVAAIQAIVSRAADEGVVSDIAEQKVITVPAVELVVSGGAEDAVAEGVAGAIDIALQQN